MEDLLRSLFTVVSPRDDFLLMVLFWSFIALTWTSILGSLKLLTEGHVRSARRQFIRSVRRRVRNRQKVFAKSHSKLGIKMYACRMPVLRNTFHRDWNVRKLLNSVLQDSGIRLRLIERIGGVHA